MKKSSSQEVSRSALVIVFTSLGAIMAVTERTVPAKVHIVIGGAIGGFIGSMVGRIIFLKGREEKE